MLRRHVTRRPDHHAGRRHRAGTEVTGDTEVDDLGSFGAEQDVRRLQVAVLYTCVVDAAQCPHEAQTEALDRFDRQRARRADRPLKGRPCHVLGGQPRLRRIRVRGEQPGRESAVHRAGRLRLPAEAVAQRRVADQFRPYRLDGHELRAGVGAPRPCIGPQIHLAHAARAEAGEDPVGADAAGGTVQEFTEHAVVPSARTSSGTCGRRPGHGPWVVMAWLRPGAPACLVPLLRCHWSSRRIR